MSFYAYLMLVSCVILKIIIIQSASEDQNYWKNAGQEDIQEALNQKINNGVAKNVILFVADGMGPTTVTASRIYGKTEKGYLSFEKFPHVGVLKTYSANKLVPDSCSTATALFCGVKANQKTAGVDATVAYEDCEASLDDKARLPSIFSWAQEVGKATGMFQKWAKLPGFVTTTRVTHATPSALYAHTPNRKWECEAKMPPNATKCKDIARQLIEDHPGNKIRVIMGGGHQCLVSDVQGTDADPIDTWACYSRDGRNLIKKWEEAKAEKGASHAVLKNNADLANLNLETDYVLGIFANGHLKMDHARDKGPKGMPSLTNMTEKAIGILSNNKKGYVLVVEGGMIDFAHHRGHARQALGETIEFSNAIQKALEMTQREASETLIIVTSDHSHSLVLSGYADRTSSILDVAQKSKTDGISYTSLLYGTGGTDNFQFETVNNEVVRRNPELDDTNDFQYAQQAVVLTDEVTHSGTDVLVYAKGAMAHLFHSVHEQTYVAYVISYAAKIGPFKDRSNYANKKVGQPLLVISISLYFSYL